MSKQKGPFFQTVAHSDDRDFEQKVKELLLYHRVVKVEAQDDQEGLLTLDNGVVLKVVGNEGCGGCGNGWYYLEYLEACDNAITNVEIEEIGVGPEIYRIYVYAEDQKIKLLEYSGGDPAGYYGTGYNLFVSVQE